VKESSVLSTQNAPVAAGVSRFCRPVCCAAFAAFKPGPELEVVQNNCTACHSADYISTQPRGLKKDFWQAEVTKMIKVYGAPVEDADVGKIVDYLAATY
jgi:hypothetical protein